MPIVDSRLFDACFHIQREACEAAGHHIPMVVENVKGAQPWVGRAAWHYGSYYLWGDVPALMPFTHSTKVEDLPVLNAHDDPRPGRKNNSGSWFAQAHNTESGHSRNPVTGEEGRKGPGGDWFANGRQGQDACAEGIKQRGSGSAWALDERRKAEGFKVPGNRLSENGFTIPVARTVNKDLKPEAFELSDEDRRQHLSFSRKAASARIAKIPFPLASWIARCFKPDSVNSAILSR
jgi:hypothetical protein